MEIEIQKKEEGAETEDSLVVVVQRFKESPGTQDI